MNTPVRTDTYNSCPIADADCHGNIRELNVIENNGALEVAVGRAAGEDESRGVGHNRIDNGLSPDTLSTGIGCAALCQVEANFTIVDCDT